MKSSKIDDILSDEEIQKIFEQALKLCAIDELKKQHDDPSYIPKIYYEFTL